jgi:translocator protein
MNKNTLRKAVEIFIAMALCHSAGIIGSVFTIKSVNTWYAELAKPAFKPPNWLFGPVWLTLYTMMAVSLYIVWRDRKRTTGSKTALSIFTVQLILNALWTPVFFGAHLLFPAFVIIFLLCVAIIATIAAFSKCSRGAALLLVPYLLWVMFASVLNYSLWILNKT